MENNARKWLVRGGAALLLLLLAGLMFLIGRGHTVYVDNKTLETGGETVGALHRVEVYVGEERLSKLAKRERTSAPVIGQRFSMRLLITKEKGDEPVEETVTLDLPYGWDGIVVNVPGYLAGLPKEAWMTEFVPAPEPVTEEDEQVVLEEDPTMMEDL